MEFLKLFWSGYSYSGVNGRTIKLETRKTAALLAYLLLNSGTYKSDTRHDFLTGRGQAKPGDHFSKIQQQIMGGCRCVLLASAKSTQLPSKRNMRREC